MNQLSASEEVCDENTRFAAAWKLHDLEVLMEMEATEKEASLQWNATGIWRSPGLGFQGLEERKKTDESNPPPLPPLPCSRSSTTTNTPPSTPTANEENTAAN